MLEARCGGFHLMLTGKEVIVAQKEETPERKNNLESTEPSLNISLIFMIDGKNLLQ